MRLLDVVGKAGYITFNVILVVCVFLVAVSAIMNFDDWRKGRVSEPLHKYVEKFEKIVSDFDGPIIGVKLYATERHVQIYLTFQKVSGSGSWETHVHLSDLGKVLGYLHLKYPDKQFEVHDFFKKISL